MDNLITQNDKMVLSVKDVVQQVKLMQQLMKSVMKENIHYGIIPGCPKPSLWKPGAEKILLTFKLAADCVEETGSVENDDEITYKIKCNLTHYPTGMLIGSGNGSCSSKEKKFKTRAILKYKATEEEKTIALREEKRTKNNKVFSVIIVPVEPHDVQNTVYKIACKRALVAAVLNATAASDIFTQDLEDMEDWERTLEAQEGKEERPDTSKAPVKEKDKKLSVGNKGNMIDVVSALNAKIGTTINVKGHFRDVVSKTTRAGTIYSYSLLDSGFEHEIIISIWEPIDVEQEGTILAFYDVTVSEYKKKKQFLAKYMEIAKDDVKDEKKEEEKENKE